MTLEVLLSFELLSHFFVVVVVVSKNKFFIIWNCFTYLLCEDSLFNVQKENEGSCHVNNTTWQKICWWVSDKGLSPNFEKKCMKRNISLLWFWVWLCENALFRFVHYLRITSVDIRDSLARLGRWSWEVEGNIGQSVMILFSWSDSVEFVSVCYQSW